MRGSHQLVKEPGQEEGRRGFLIETTIDALADYGYVGTTLSRIAERAGVSAGLVAHYFGDKDGLLFAAFRSVASQLRQIVLDRLRGAHTPRERIMALIDANLGPGEFDRRSGAVWLAFWGQVPHSPSLRRVQAVYQQRIVTNLRHELRQLAAPDVASRLATLIASLIDGIWLRAALSGWTETDSATARQMVRTFVDTSLATAPPPAPRQARPAVPRIQSHVGGRFLPARTPALFTSINPATGEVLAEIEAAGPAEVEAAVAAARAAQPGWAGTPGAERARILRRVAERLRAHNDELAELETRDTGKPIQETRVVDVISGAECLEYFAAIAATLAGEHVDLGNPAFGYTRREPLGIVAGIGAWNYPLQIACWKAAPALACGNAMIFKPAELTPLSAARLAEIMVEAGVPPGIFNVVPGDAATGRLLTAHPEIRKVSLTGEVGTGKAVIQASAATLKAVTLELGGKSPLIVFEDADLDNAVAGALLANFYSAGEVCSNGTRVFVQESVREAFLEKLVARVEKLVIGDPLDPRTQVGALISEPHMQKVLGYIERGRAEGARLAIGGDRVTRGGLDRGNFVAPAIFDGCTDGMAIVREEIFGPVMAVLGFRDEEEVVARANATEFGLAAGLFTADLTRAHRVIARLQAGTCWINHYNITPIELPFGGVKLSGLGRENGRAAIEHYTQTKSVYVALAPIDAPY